MPPRASKGRNLTFDLTSSAAKAAFEAAGLDEDYSSNNLQNSKKGKAAKAKKQSTLLLREGSGSSLQAHDRQSRQLQHDSSNSLLSLLDMFSGSLDSSIIKDVLVSCGGSVEDAVPALLLLSSGGGAPGAESGLGQQQGPGDAVSATEAATNLWELLPPDLKDLVYSLLNVRELARAARTCHDFAARSALGRTNARHVAIPAGLSPAAVTGLVASHPNARNLSLRQWAHVPMGVESFQKLVWAVAAGSRSSRRVVPVQAISLRGCSWLTDADVVLLLDCLPHLREVDLADCTAITDAILPSIARYTALSPPAPTMSTSQPLPAAASHVLGNHGTNEYLLALGTSLQQQQQEDQQQQQHLEALQLTAEQKPAWEGADGALLDAGHVVDEFAADLRQAMADSMAAAADADCVCQALQLDGAADEMDLRLELWPSDVTYGDAAAGGVLQADDAHEDSSTLNLAQQLLGDINGGHHLAHTSSTAISTAFAPVSGPHLAECRDDLGPWDALRVAVDDLTPRLPGSARLGLSSLSLAGCRSLSSEGIRSLLSVPLVRGCLERLDVSRLPRLTRAGLQLGTTGSLRSLRASGCGNLRELLLQLPATAPLAELQLSGCKTLSRLLLVVPQLRSLNIASCPNLTSLQIRCPRLEELNMPLCFKLTSLQEPDAWSVPCLSRLNIFGCRHLEAAAVDKLLQLAGGSLKHLDVNGCGTLVTLRIEGNPALESLDASSCASLLSLHVSSPHLTSLRVTACPNLRDITIPSPSFGHLDASHCSSLMWLTLGALRSLSGLQGAHLAAAAVDVVAASQRSSCSSITWPASVNASIGALSDLGTSDQKRGKGGGRAAAGGSGGAGLGVLQLRLQGCGQLSPEIIAQVSALRAAARSAVAMATAMPQT